jgi:hypothetical protein
MMAPKSAPKLVSGLEAPVDLVTGEPVEEALPETASPPPPTSGQKQKVSGKLDLDSIRKNRLMVTAVTGEILRIPVTDSPSSESYIRAHPVFGGLNDPMPIWKRTGLGKGGSGLLLADPRMVDRIRAFGGKVAMCGLWWCQYSIGGQFLVICNAESDNDWHTTARGVYEACRTGWYKRINAGNCWEKLPPPKGVVIPDPDWAAITWDEVLNFAFQEAVVDDSHPAFQELMYGGHAPVVKG